MNDVSWTAARVLGRGAVKGHLELSGTHLRFRPAGMAARVAGTPFAVQLKHVGAVGVVEAEGGLLRRRRSRLCVTLGDGSEQLFEVAQPGEVAAAVRAQLPGGAR